MSKKKAPHLRGKVEVVDLVGFRPNGWNPNKVPDHIMKSIRHGFSEDGWLTSQALLVWRTDEKGEPQNVIIDGEHRWLAALDVGLRKGPVVFLDGVTEAEAKALTIKLNQKRGEWDEVALTRLVAELDIPKVSVGALDLGFSDDELSAMLDIDLSTLGGDTRADEEEEEDKPLQRHYSVLIECEDEAEQADVLKECTGKGWRCRALI